MNRARKVLKRKRRKEEKRKTMSFILFFKNLIFILVRASLVFNLMPKKEVTQSLWAREKRKRWEEKRRWEKMSFSLQDILFWPIYLASTVTCITRAYFYNSRARFPRAFLLAFFLLPSFFGNWKKVVLFLMMTVMLGEGEEGEWYINLHIDKRRAKNALQKNCWKKTATKNINDWKGQKNKRVTKELLQ